MSDMKMYGILGKFNNLNPEMKALDPKKATKEPVYEEVQPRGSIAEAVRSLEEKYMGFKAVEKAAKAGGAKNPAAVAASIGRKKYGKKKFQKAAAAGKKLGEGAKPDFLDVDGDGNKKEPFKKAVKDKKAVKEGQGPYELYNPKHPKFKANYDKYKAKHPDCTLAEFVAAMKKKEHGVNEGKFDEPAAPDADAIAKRKRLQAIKDRQEDKGDIFAKEKNTPIRKVAGKAYGGAAQKDAEEKDDLDEMTSSTGGEITRKGNVTTHKANKYGGAEEHPNHSGNLKDIMDRKSRHRVVDLGDPEDYDLDETIVKEKAVSKQQQKFMGMVHAVQKGKMKAPSNKIANVAKGMTTKAAHDFAATKHKGLPTKVTEGKEAIRHHPIYTDKDAWDHYKKELDEQEVMDDVRNVQQELDEIAKLAGVPIACPKCSSAPCQCNEELSSVNTETPLSHELSGTHCVQCNESPCSCSHEELDEREQFQSMPKATSPAPIPAAPAVDPNRQSKDRSHLKMSPAPVREEEMEEGNEFSGALAAAKAAGQKEFEVDGKKYTVKEDINVNITANGEEDALNLIRKLSGMAEVHAEPVVVADVEEELDEQHSNHNVINRTKRDVENLNTPREDYAAADITTMTGTGLDKKKTEIEFAPPIGDNPLQAKKKHGEIGEAALWKQYEAMLNEITK